MEHAVDIGTGRTVVFVEDEALVRDVAVCELEDHGFKVVEFPSADEALPYLSRHGGDACVVVTDVQMPGALNGLQLVEIVSHLWPRTPMLVTSGGSLVDPQRLPPSVRFLRKPWHPSEMVDRVARLAGGAAARA